MAASMDLCATAGRSGLPFLFSAKGKLKRRVPMPDSARDWERDFMKIWFIPAPAPWAIVMMYVGWSGTWYSADTEPIEGEIWREKDFVLMARRFGGKS